MARRYTDIYKDKWALSGYSKSPVRGLLLIHLFNEVWKIGRLKQKKNKLDHCVIYGPDDKEYDVYDKDARQLYKQRCKWDKKRADQAIVKIYILTHILDDIDYWNFNMDEKPEIKMPVKVIYNNGTIKWIDFTGEWEKINIKIKYYGDPGFNKELMPIAWRIKNK